MTSSASPHQQQGSPVAPGTLLANKYRVERILGRGGMGYVVEARHVALDERVALKFLLPEYTQHPEAATRFLREARAAVKIKSEHVARVSDVGTLENGAPYMVMEFLHGEDLSQVLVTKGLLPIEDAIDYILQACEAIAEAHTHGIVHRDLKPANLFLAKRIDGTPLVKVLDFGISKMSGPADHGLTKTSTAMGSALYMSPEQMQETRGVDNRTDIYSLGITLFELLAGKQPFFAETLPQLCAEVLTGTPKPIGFYRRDIPSELATRIERAYERDKALRYQSIAEFVVAIAPWAPLRSQGTIDRIARMSGLTAPLAGSGSAMAEPHRQSYGSAPSFARDLAIGPTVLAPAGATNRASSPSYPSEQAQTSKLPATNAPNQGQPKTVPLPVMDIAPEQGAPVASVTTPTPLRIAMPVEPNASRIEADIYQGPMSAHAAAAFANAAKPAPTSGSRKVMIVALIIGAVIGIGGGAIVFTTLRSKPATSDPIKVQGTVASPSPTTTSEGEEQHPEAASPGTVVEPSASALPASPGASSATTPATRPSATKSRKDLFGGR